MIDMYPYVRERFREKGLPLPYGEGRFAPDRGLLRDVDEMLMEIREFWANEGLIQQVPNLRFESCAEPGLKQAVPCGCISEYDLKLLGLESDIGYDGSARKVIEGLHVLCGKKQNCSIIAIHANTAVYTATGRLKRRIDNNKPSPSGETGWVLFRITLF